MKHHHPPRPTAKPNPSILKGHKRVGKRFVPPLGQIPGKITPISYVQELLPELLWIGLINDSLGYRQSVAFYSSIAETAHNVYHTSADVKHRNFALCSQYGRLTHEQQGRLCASMAAAGSLSTLQQILSPLVDNYPEFPMSFIGRTPCSSSLEDQLETLKRTVKDHFDKYELGGMSLQVATMYVAGLTGGLFLAETLEPPDLDAALFEPESEKGKRSAAFVRSSVLAMARVDEAEGLPKWPIEFWNRNYSISPCMYPREEKDE